MESVRATRERNESRSTASMKLPNHNSQQHRLPSTRDASIMTLGQKNRKIKINVGGEIHESFVSTLSNIPDSPLAWILDEKYRKHLDYEVENGELFFDRHPGIFAQILDYFQTGKLHSPRNVCGPMFQEELRFWGIQEQQMECCCWHDYTRHRVTQESLKVFEAAAEKRDTTIITKTHELIDIEHGSETPQSSITGGFEESKSKWKTKKAKMWKILDQPQASSASKVYAWITLGFIILSIVSFTVYTIDSSNTILKCDVISSNASGINTSKHQLESNNTSSNSSSNCKKISNSKLWFAIAPIEGLCATWFTLEIILRAISSPNKVEHMKNPFTILDIIAVAMSYVLLFGTNTNSADIVGILNMARLFRISRFFKIIYSLQVLGRSLKASAYHFMILLILLIIPVILFSSLIYYTEQNWGTANSKSDMSSIPKSLWWAVATMTTVGYGDAVPESIPGFFVGGVAAVFGVIILSLTGSILGSTFQQYYNLAKTQRKIPKNRQNRVEVSLESLHEMVGLPITPNELPKPSIESGHSKSSGRDSGYGKSPVVIIAKKRLVRSLSHPATQCQTSGKTQLEAP
eukprot:gene7754-8598_t